MLALVVFCTPAVVAHGEDLGTVLGCELALLGTVPYRLEFEPNVATDLIEDPGAFVRAFDALIADAVPAPGADHPRTFQTLYVQNKLKDDLVHVELRRGIDQTILISGLQKMTRFQENAFYGTYAYHHEFELVIFRFDDAADGLTVDEESFGEVTLSPSIQAKIWVKHRLNLDVIRAIMAKTRFARPVERPNVSAAYVTYRGIPYRLYFYKIGRSLSLRTIYQCGPKLKRTKKPRAATQPAA